MDKHFKNLKQLVNDRLHDSAIRDAFLKSLAAIEEEQNSLNDQLEFERGRFFESLRFMSHGLRANLATLLGHAEILRTQYDDASVDEPAFHVDHILSAAKRLEFFLHDMILLSNLKTGRMPIHIAPARIEVLVDEIKTLFDYNNVNFICQSLVESTFVLIDSVIFNLILERLFYSHIKSPDEQTIELVVSESAGSIQFAFVANPIVYRDVESLVSVYRFVLQHQADITGFLEARLSVAYNLCLAMNGSLSINRADNGKLGILMEFDARQTVGSHLNVE